MDIEKTLIAFVLLIVLSLFLAGWIKIEQNKYLSDAPVVARFIALLLIFPLWLICVFSLAEEVVKW